MKLKPKTIEELGVILKDDFNLILKN